jgi:hypothetical protein
VGSGSLTTIYGPYDKNSRLTQLIFTAGSNSLGQINYTLDADGRVTGASGALANLNLPQSEGPKTYSNTNQITSWNGTTATSDSATNLTKDPLVTDVRWLRASQAKAAPVVGYQRTARLAAVLQNKMLNSILKSGL